MPDEKAAKATAAVEALCEYIIAWSHGGPRAPETKLGRIHAIEAMAGLGGAKLAKAKRAYKPRKKK